MHRAKPSEDESEVELELEYFELIDVGASLALLRVAGRWVGIDPDDLDVPKLLVDDGERRHRLLPLDEDGTPDERLWHAGFVASALGDRATRAQYSLDVGVVVDLPRPARRRLADGEARPPAPEPEPEPEPAEAAVTRRRGPGRAIAAAGVLTVLVVAGIVTTLVGSGDSPQAPAAPATAPTAGEPPPAPPRRTALGPVAGGGAAMSTARGAVVSFADGRRTLELGRLAPGRYVVWLFDSVIDARRLATVRGPAGRVELPRGAELTAFRFVDVSREDDRNPNHSGRSVLRLPTAGLR